MPLYGDPKFSTKHHLHLESTNPSFPPAHAVDSPKLKKFAYVRNRRDYPDHIDRGASCTLVNVAFVRTLQ